MNKYVFTFLLFCCTNSFAKHLSTLDLFSAFQDSTSIVIDDSVAAEKYFEKAISFGDSGQYENSYIFLLKASLIFKKSENWEGYVKCYNEIAENLISENKYDAALDSLNKLLEIGLYELGNTDSLVGKIYYNIGLAHTEKNETKKAFDFFSKAIAIWERDKNRHKADLALCYELLGSIYRHRSDFKNSLKYHNKSKSINLEIFGDSHPNLSDNYYSLAVINGLKGNHDESVQYFNKSLDIRIQYFGRHHKKVSDCFIGIGISYSLIGDYITATPYMEDALKILLNILQEDDPAFYFSYLNLASVYLYRGNYDKALENNMKALKIANQSFGENTAYVARSYNNIGAVYERKGDYEIALIYFQKALKIRLELFDSNDPNIAESYGNIGGIYQLYKIYDKSIKYFKNALSIEIKTFGLQHLTVADSFIDVSNLFLETSQLDSALTYIRKAFAILEEYNNSNTASCMHTFGKVYFRKGDYKKSLEYFNRALSVYKNSLTEVHPKVARAYRQIGDVYNKKDNFSESLNNYQKAITSLITGSNSSDVVSNLDLVNISSEKELLQILKRKAAILDKIYSINSDNTDDLKLSVSTYLLASELIKKMRISYKTEGSKLFLTDINSKIYDDAIHTALKLYRHSRDNRDKELVFRFAEENKATILHESISKSNAKKYSGITDSLLKKEKALRIDLTFYDTEINKEKQKGVKAFDSSKIGEYEDKFFDLNIEYQELLSKFEKDYPRYYNLKYENDVLSVEEIQQRLDENEVLLQYFAGDSSLFIFTIDKSNYDVYSGTPPKNSTIRKLNNSIYNLDTDEYLESSYLLYTKLIKPVEEKIKGKQILLIPDGILHYVPFDALLTKDVKQKAKIDYSALPYLINDYNIRYAYSATLALKEIVGATANTANEDSFLGMAPVFEDGTIQADLISRELSIIDTMNKDIYRAMKRSFLDEKSTFNPLPASEEEITNIYKMFKKSNKPAKTYLHSDATEDLLKSNKTNSYKYVHLATHAFMNEKNPKLSGIVLAADSSKTEDGVLYSEEIYNLYLNADLVVLSACESGLGEIVRGEGIIGFTRGLMFSGAKNVIVSLWNVVDRSTAAFMTDLYSKILEGKSYTTALRDVKLRFINSDKYSEPFYWGAFKLVGN